MVDQGIIDGPSLQPTLKTKVNYTPGYLSPWKFPHWLNTKKEEEGLKLPFASAKYGKKPANSTDWSFAAGQGPLAGDRSSLEYAQALFRTKGAPDRDIGRPGYSAPASTPGPSGT
jgi:hypothetical protein